MTVTGQERTDGQPIQAQEEEGLRAFSLRVESERDGEAVIPRAIDVGGERLPVVTLEATWRELERIGYRVRLANGASMLVYYVPVLELWSGVERQATGDPRITLKRRTT